AEAALEAQARVERGFGCQAVDVIGRRAAEGVQAVVGLIDAELRCHVPARAGEVPARRRAQDAAKGALPLRRLEASEITVQFGRQAGAVIRPGEVKAELRELAIGAHGRRDGRIKWRLIDELKKGRA